MINGQKIWTSDAYIADGFFVLVRTDPLAPKHRGISFLLIDGNTRGLSVRPLVNMGWDHEFNETFFEDVRVPVSKREGEENRGWYVGMTVLDFERSNVTGAVSARRTIDLLVSHATGDGATYSRLGELETLRHEIAERFIETEVMYNFSFRIISMQEQGLIPNDEASTSKLFNSELVQRLANTGSRPSGYTTTSGTPTTSVRRCARASSSRTSAASLRRSPPAPQRSSATSSPRAGWGCLAASAARAGGVERSPRCIGGRPARPQLWVWYNEDTMAVVQTTSGALAGTEEGGLQVFRGVPFAQPPLGDQRWRAPQPIEPWSGERDASAFRAAAMQPPRTATAQSSFAGLFGAGELETSEDCLTLNVWTPGLDGARPVMVWIHGGGFRSGTGSSPMYDGAALASRGGVVVVTVNYRLGVLGYLLCDGLDANVGSLDQVAALEWVRDEIARFGGDPGQVTIFGQSAGGKSVETLLAMPAARGLFHRAIMQSTYDPQMEPAVAAEGAARLVGQLGVGPDPTALRGLDAAEVIEGQFALREAAASGGGDPRSFRLWASLSDPVIGTNPVVDGDSLPRHPLEAIAAGEAAAIPVLIGTTLEESKLFGLFAPPEQPRTSDESLLERLAPQLPDEAQRVAAVETYRSVRAARGANASAHEVLMAITGDRMLRYHSTRLAELQSRHQALTFMYLFSWRSELMDELGSCHALELPFVFDTFETPLGRLAGTSDAAHALSAQMQDAWIAFAKTGDPNHEALPAWPRYEATHRSTMVLDAECRVERAPLEPERHFWDSWSA